MCATLQIVVAHTKSAVTHPAARDDAAPTQHVATSWPTHARSSALHHEPWAVDQESWTKTT